MFTTIKVKDGQYHVYENNKNIGTIDFQCESCDQDVLKKHYCIDIPKYSLKKVVKFPVQDFKNVERTALRTLIDWLKARRRLM